MGTVEAFLAGCPATPATAARRVAAIGWHHRHSPTGPPVAGIPDRRALRAGLGRPPPAPTRPPPDPDALAAARAALDRAAALTSASPHRCRTTPAPDSGGDVGGDPVFTPIDQHGYPDLDRALARPRWPASPLGTWTDGSRRGGSWPQPRGPPSRRPLLPRRQRPAPPRCRPSTGHTLDRRRDDLRQLDALDRLLADLERQADRANQQITALDP